MFRQYRFSFWGRWCFVLDFFYGGGLKSSLIPNKFNKRPMLLWKSHSFYQCNFSLQHQSTCMEWRVYQTLYRTFILRSRELRQTFVLSNRTWIEYLTRSPTSTPVSKPSYGYCPTAVHRSRRMFLIRLFRRWAGRIFPLALITVMMFLYLI